MWQGGNAKETEEKRKEDGRTGRKILDPQSYELPRTLNCLLPRIVFRTRSKLGIIGEYDIL
jgi:hypothetical protein